MMSGMLACSMLMSDASLPWERPTDPPGIPAKPPKRLCSPWNKSRIEASLFWFHATVKSTGRWKAPPQRRFMRTGSSGIVYKSAAKYAQPQKSHNTMSSLQIPPYSKKATQWKGWRREDPFFVRRWHNGGLLGDGMVIAAAFTCYKGASSVRTKEDQGYVSGHGPWEPPDGSLLLVSWCETWHHSLGRATLPLGAKWFWTACWDSLLSWGTSNQPLSSGRCSTKVIPGKLIKLLNERKKIKVTHFVWTCNKTRT